MLARMQLFHTPPSRAEPVTRTRTDDPRIDATYVEHAQTKLPADTDFAKELDFHKIVAAMNSYPTVLRRLGLVVDLVVDRDRYADYPDSLLWAEVTFPAGGLQVAKSAGDVSPRTHATLSASTFAAHSNPVPPSASELRVPDRLLDLDPKRFALLEMDVDGIGLKLLNFARSLGRVLVDQEQRVDPVTRFEKESGAPSLRTAGMMLVHRERSDALKAALAASKAKNDLAGPVLAGTPGALPPVLWAEDAVRGFRFDVWDADTGVWRSLCRREAVYEVGEGGAAVTVTPEAGEEEGTVRLAATTTPDPKTNPDLIWLHEAVVSWTGWSLVAPPPGRAIRPDDTVDTTEAQTDAELPPGLSFRSRYRAVRRSLPRLRFGRRYWIRARAVDLAGNALPPQADDFGPEDPRHRAQPFLRYEPVVAPVIALVEPEGGGPEAPAEGESMQRMAIRTFNDVPADNAVPSVQRARRFAVPAQVSSKDAEYHGMLDAGGRVDPTTFDLLANQKDLDATDPAAALVEVKIPLKGPSSRRRCPPPSPSTRTATP